MKPANAMKIKDPRKMVISVVGCLLAGMIGSVFTYPQIAGWYDTLNKPFFTPPNWLFGPAWTTLYILMGISLYVVWSKTARPGEKDGAMQVFMVQLALNVLWSIIFFGFMSPVFAFVEILALWASIAATMILFRRISRKAAWLLVPYICWVTFAAALNMAVWLIN
jgi:tryptophan-rich sensory protein